MSFNDPQRDEAADALRERFRRARGERVARATTTRERPAAAVTTTRRHWLLLIAFAVVVVVIAQGL